MNGALAELTDLARALRQRAQALGADEVSVSVSTATHASLRRRDGRTEQSTGATTRGLSVSVLVGDRFTSNSTSDLRPEALEAFLRRCVDAARWLEPDPARRLPEPEVVGRGVSEAHLDSDDPSWATREPVDREAAAEALEQAVAARAGLDRVSIVAAVADGRSASFRTSTNGFEDGSAGTFFSVSGQLVLAEGDKRPTAGADWSARHLTDLPPVERIADEVVERTTWSVGSRPLPSGRYPLLLENRVSARILSMMAAPLSGAALHERRSCLLDRRGTLVASPLLDVVDDPTIPRGSGSRPWDGEGRTARPMPVLRDGVLENWYLSTYHARKLGLPATTGSRSNWVLRPGTRPFAAIAASLPRAVSITSFLGGSANSTTGDFSFGVRGVLLEHGVVTAHLSEMNVTGNLLVMLREVAEIGNDPFTHGAVRTPAMFWPEVQLTGT